jgi:hypothetical protein
MAAFLARRHADPVEVVRRDAAPARFHWRDRRYDVREVLDHWLRTGAWWQAAALTRLASGEPAPDGSSATLDDEWEFWRVEAAPGYGGPPAVVELCHDLASGRWTVTAVLD